MNDAGVAIRYEQRVWMTKRQVRCCVCGACSEWRDLTVEDAAVLDAEAALPSGACLDVEAMFRIARACWGSPEALEGKRD